MLLSSGAGIAQWLERRARDRKVAGSSPDRTGGKLFFLFFLQGQLSVLNHISVSVLHLCYAAARKKKISVIHPNVQVEGYMQLRDTLMHPMYVVLYAMT